MDIEYLLLLQKLRESTNDLLTPFFESVSLFAVTYLIIVPAFIYWCVNKRSGLYAMASYTASVALNAVVKLSACVYRPWIRDYRVLPAGDSIRTATSYSFPSGHTSTATPIYGALAVRARKKNRWITVLCVIAIVLTAFSRNYLGVHTPQDVLVALLIGGVMLLAMSKLFGYIIKNPDKEPYFLLAGIIAGFAAIAYISMKPYPMDYVNGQLLVDPQKMMKDGFGDIGMFIAFCAGRWIEIKWIKFKPSRTRSGLKAGIVGLVILFFLIELLGGVTKALFGLHWGAFAEESIITLFIMAGWPAVMKAIAARVQKAKVTKPA